jgi:hypothetical protein
MKAARSSPPYDAAKETEAIHLLVERWTNAVGYLCALDRPQWQRTQDAMQAFKGLPITHLPPKLVRRIEKRFVRINAILKNYPINTWEDFAQVTPADLTQIELLLRDLI